MSELMPDNTLALDATVEAKPHGDKHIWGIYIILVLISLVELYSASSREVASSSLGVFGPLLRHGGMLFVGFLIICLLQRFHYSKMIIWILVFALFSVVSMIYVMIAGEIVNGARRSFTLLGFTMQPSEFLKLSAAMLVALIMSRSQIKGGVTNKGIILCASVIIFFAALLYKQGMTNTILLMVISLSMMIIGGVQWKKFFLVILVYILAGGFFWGLQQVTGGGEEDGEVDRSTTWQARIERYIGDGKPKYEQEINAKNRQEMYSFMAQANGGIAGVFPGNSRETARLPLAFSDFIYAIVIEDMGLIGGIAVLVLYLWLLARASSIASRCSRALPALLVIGMAVMIVYQALSHIAIVSGVSPVSGQPLPLISKGGTSILITSIAFGIMLSVSRHAVRSGKRAEINDEMNSLPEEMRAENPTRL